MSRGRRQLDERELPRAPGVAALPQHLGVPGMRARGLLGKREANLIKDAGGGLSSNEAAAALPAPIRHLAAHNLSTLPKGAGAPAPRR